MSQYSSKLVETSLSRFSVIDDKVLNVSGVRFLFFDFEL